MSRTKIEWATDSWNPLRARNRKSGKLGWWCVHAGEGCRYCYAERMNERLGMGIAYRAQDEAQVEVFLDEQTLLHPLHWRKPRKIFVCSMTDLFGAWVKDEWLDRIYAAMALCPQHIFIVLTKRPERMRDYLLERWQPAPVQRINLGGGDIWDIPAEPPEGTDRRDRIDETIEELIRDYWLFPNVWAGCSCSTQEEANALIPAVLATPLAKRIVSLEPLLGPINLKRIQVDGHGWQDALEGWRECKDYPGRENLLDWVICGGESGPGARPMHPQWARDLREQCRSANVPFFFKQWGEWKNGSDFAVDAHVVLSNGQYFDISHAPRIDDYARLNPTMMRRVGKRAAGRLLDGVEHNEFPEVPEPPK